MPVRVRVLIPILILLAGAVCICAQQPEFKAMKAEFAPGEKTLFFDDFADMTAGEAPPHFKVRGGTPELQEAGGVRQLSTKANGVMTLNLTAVPKNFTFETEVLVDTPQGSASMTVSFFSKNREVFDFGVRQQEKNIDLVMHKKGPYEELGRKRLVAGKEPVKVALWIQNGRVQLFLNGEKQIDANQVELPPIDKVDIGNGFIGTGKASLNYRSVRVAESTPDFSQVIMSAGRYVSHGILFDTGSDKLKPESAAVLQAIVKGLTANPALKVLIEGHTDSVGVAAQNLDLSKRRAEAVKTVLVSQFQIEAARLTTAGLGSTKPIDSNDTPTGRAQNRRVELVKVLK
jgi:OmpA-OmpF porin, OOP family